MHRRRASPASSTSALSTGTQPTATTEGSREKILANTSLNLLISALKITKEVSSACPELQLAVRALLAVLDIYKVCRRMDCVRNLRCSHFLTHLPASMLNAHCSQRHSEATEAIETLLSRIHPLNEILKKVQTDGGCPQALKDRLAALAR